MERTKNNIGATLPSREPVAQITKNLSHWHGEISPLQELCTWQAKELARLLWAQKERTADASLLERTATAVFDKKRADTALSHTQCLCEMLSFCEALLALDSATPRAEKTPPFIKEAPVRVACLNTPLFSECLRHFTDVAPNATLMPISTFTEVSEAVGDGRADFGILPIENERDGKLFHFYEQIEREGLSIYCTKSMTLPEGEERSRFALIGKEPPPSVAIGQQILECILFEEDDYSLTDLLFAAKAAGFALRRMDSLPATYREDGFSHHPTFEAVDNANTALLEIFLSLFMPRTVISAKYPHLN